MTLELPPVEEVAALRLVAVDLDGTLLDADHRVDPRFWDLVDRWRARGVEVVVASGRQRQSLEAVLGDRLDELDVICDNGALLVRAGAVVHAEPVGPEAVGEVTRRIRALAQAGHQVASSFSSPDGAWLEGAGDVAAQARVYYPSAVVVPDITAVRATALKISVFDAAPIAEAVLPALADLAGRYALIQGHRHWVDINALGVDKGTALAHLQALLGVSPAQTAAFGDHLNDVGMLTDAGMSYAMANAHPDVRAVARFRAPANTEAGVLQVLGGMLELVGG